MLKSVQFGVARLLSRDGYVEARAAPFGLRFKGPAADCITRHIYRIGAHEPTITRFVLEQVRLAEGEVAIDIGANIGWYSVLLNRLAAPGARIIAFEPDPECYGLLCGNLAINGATQVTPLNTALGEQAGSADLHRYRHSNNGCHTLLAGNTSGGIVRVPVDTLQAAWDRLELGASPVRFVKVDVEGFEYFVLRGAGPLLARMSCVLLEYSPASLALAGLEPQAFTDLLSQAGLRVAAFEGASLRPMSLTALAAARVQLDLVLRPA